MNPEGRPQTGARRRGAHPGESWLDRGLLMLPAPPLVAGLSPQIDAVVCVGWRQLAGTEVPRAELLRDALRRQVRRVDRMNHVRPPERVEGPVAGRDRALDRVPLAPAVPGNRPSDLGTGPSLRLPWTEPADPAPALFLDHREHCETQRVPGANHRHQGPPAH